MVYLHYDRLDEQSKLVCLLQLYLRASDILLSGSEEENMIRKISAVWAGGIVTLFLFWS